MEQKDLLNMDIEEFEESIAEDERKEFKLNTPQLCDWAIEKIKEEKARCQMFVDVANSKIEILKEQIKEEQRKSESRNSYLLFKLNEYLDMDGVPAKTTKTSKKLVLPSGVIKRTLEKLDFESTCGTKELKKDEKLIAWAKDNAKEFIKTEESVLWGDLKKDLEIVPSEIGYDIMVKSTGEILDCLRVVEKPISVDVE